MIRGLFAWLSGVFLLFFWGIPVACFWSVSALLRGRKLVRWYGWADGGGMYLWASERRWIREALLPLLLVAGKAALCGRRFRYADEAPADVALRQYIPALFSPWTLYVRCRLGIKTRDEVELEFCRRPSLRADIGLLLKTFFVVMFFPLPQTQAMLPELRLFGIPFSNLTLEQAVRQIADAVASPVPEGRTIFFVNPHCFNLARADAEYGAILRQADWRYPDGSGIVMAGRMVGTPLLQNVNGTDLFPLLCRMAAERGHSLFLLGGRPGRVEEVRERMTAEFPGLRFAGVQDGYFDQERGSTEVIARINQARPDILLVGMGMPMQEKWLIAHRHELQVPVRLAVGGLFDFYSGSISRAPAWLREIGLEWCFRLLLEPRRMWKRYLVGNPRFLLAVWRWRRAGRHYG